MNIPKPLDVADLIFSNATSDVNKVLGDIRRSTLSIRNRLRSIEQDARFVRDVSDKYRLPLVANERCGSWYIDPSEKVQSAYFKSTDGHHAQWSFSLRRLNLQVLDTIVQYGGCLIVDSTRRGKSMPDALSKTVPIWICVLNRFFFPHLTTSHDFRSPPSVISESEHSQIEQRINGFVQQLSSLGLQLDPIRSRLIKPLRPLWVTQDTTLPSEAPSFEDFYPIVLCTASRQVQGGQASNDGYIQGAADDHESWAHGLTAMAFWQHKDVLLTTPEDDLPDTIAALSNILTALTAQSTLIQPTKLLHIGTLDAADAPETKWSIVITCAPHSSQTETAEPSSTDTKHLRLTCGAGKVGSRQLRHELPKITQLLDDSLGSGTGREKILVACPSGKDHSVGVALAILCLYIDDNGLLRSGDGGQRQGNGLVNKHFIKQRLSWIMLSIPDANPSRATLQSVNAFLLG